MRKTKIVFIELLMMGLPFLYGLWRVHGEISEGFSVPSYLDSSIAFYIGTFGFLLLWGKIGVFAALIIETLIRILIVAGIIRFSAAGKVNWWIVFIVPFFYGVINLLIGSLLIVYVGA